ncbi:Bug family tripartite tricarboxylate transporter substrate binding protein [Roseococcus suduntuyensis]|uniref:Tripartite-type tricarboxylate transporter receptor subunit TctC n=1 Tax=Roseococcus suduntuyensis TaxID=455361 RepID=A0A840AFG3_9PROT|nr:tripartite tricarboxylate transporter substrate binding protein [Roseococcus suduntuyensis]MBB3899642.1 tripartite-type tricarboxylate transporter receptor subunit TctC [Roseococcus suduntuyensis]
MPTKRGLLIAGAGLLAAPAIAQQRVTRLLVTFPPGGSTDILGRIIAPAIERHLGHTVVVDNRGGANGAVAMAALASAPADGSTFALDAGGATTNPHLMRGLGFDYATAFAPVTQATILPALLIVRGDSPIRDFQGFVAHARANPGQVSYGSSGVGTGSHLAGALLMRRAQLQATHVPYRGGADQLTSIRRGDTITTFSTIPTIAGLIRDGAIRPLVASTPQRARAYPDVPTVAESGFAGFSIYDFHAIYAPANTPSEAVSRMASAVRAAMNDPELQQRFLSLGLEPAAHGPEAFATFLRQRREEMGALIQAEGIRLEG